MRGRKTKPTHLKLLEGNPGKRAINKNEPKPIGDLCDPPSWMTNQQKDGWNYAITHAPQGMLKMIDQSALSVWVIAEDMHRDASKKVQTLGMLVKSPAGMPMQSPYLCILNKQAQIMLKAAEQLGFTPASRPRITSGDIEDTSYEIADARERLARLIARQNKS